MIFHDDRVKISNTFSDGGQVARGYGSGIEEIAAVVEFEMGCRGQLLKCEVDLLRDLSWRESFRQGVLPEVTHQAVERAFAIGKEDRRNSLHSTMPGKLLFT